MILLHFYLLNIQMWLNGSFLYLVALQRHRQTQLGNGEVIEAGSQRRFFSICLVHINNIDSTLVAIYTLL